jgi:GTPase SAR1 family protein
LSIILLEGCDGAGKTTLAERLVEYTRGRGNTAELIHRGVPERHPLEEYEYDLEQLDPAANHLLVMDRWHLGQLVYGGLYRDENLLGLGGAWHVDALLKRYGALQFIVAPPLGEIRRRLGVRGEDYLKAEHVEHVWRTYMDLGHRFDIPILTDDLDDEDLRVMVDTAFSRAARNEPLRAFSTYVGPRFPEILLVGEKHGPTKKGRAPHRAAFVPYPSTSGKWLCDAIVSQQVLGTNRIGLVNALQDDIANLVDVLGQPKIVALGNAAAAECDRLDLSFGQLPHPQYMRRFQNGSVETYAAWIPVAADEQRKVFA